MLALLPSAVVLGSAALLALILTLTRRAHDAKNTERRAAARALAIATAIQSVHFVEEAATGFHEQFGPLVGLPPMSYAFFLGFNLTWIAIWIASIWGLRTGRLDATFAAWFLAIAGLLNGIGHPGMAFAAGGYFPGLVSGPVVGVASVWLATRLWRAEALRG